MAPEQVKSYADKDVRTDIYALGALLYNLLTGELPVSGKSLEDLLKKTETGDLTPCANHENGKGSPSSLESILKKSLALSPDDRYQSVRDLQVDLNKYLGGFATEAENANALKLFSSMSIGIISESISK